MRIWRPLAVTYKTSSRLARELIKLSAVAFNKIKVKSTYFMFTLLIDVSPKFIVIYRDWFSR